MQRKVWDNILPRYLQFVEQYLTQIKLQIVEQIGCDDSDFTVWNFIGAKYCPSIQRIVWNDILPRYLRFIEVQYLSQIEFQIVEQFGCVEV